MISRTMKNKQQSSITIEQLAELDSNLGSTQLSGWIQGQQLLQHLQAQSSDLDDTELAAAAAVYRSRASPPVFGSASPLKTRRIQD